MKTMKNAKPVNYTIDGFKEHRNKELIYTEFPYPRADHDDYIAARKVLKALISGAMKVVVTGDTPYQRGYRDALVLVDKNIDFVMGKSNEDN